MVWNRAFDWFSRLTAYQKILELAGLWKFIWIGAAVLGTVLLGLWAAILRLPLPVIVVLVLICLAALTALIGHGINGYERLAAWKASRPEVNLKVSRKAKVIVAILVVLAAIGWIASRSRVSTIPTPSPPQAKVEAKETPAGSMPASGETKQTPPPSPRKPVATVRKPSVTKESAATSESGEKAPPQPQQPPAPMVVAPGGAVSFGQQGGITAGQVNILPTKRERSLPEDVQEAMCVELQKDPGTVTISAFMGDGEAYRLAKQFRTVFERAGWKLKDNAISSFMMSGEPWTGVQVELPSVGTVGETVNISGSRWLGFSVVDRALKFLKMEYSAKVVPSPTEQPPSISVGPRGN